VLRSGVLLGSSRSAVIVIGPEGDANARDSMFGPISALVAAPPSPVLPDVPFPATVEMIPPGVIIRTRKFPLSQKKRFPNESRFRKLLDPILALRAGPPSPLNPNVPVPAIVLISPAAIETLNRT
jgi:hypothetical protein